MVRQKNTRPTHIYWLVDTRTGLPFYCGKTVNTIEYRLATHRRNAKAHPHRPMAIKLLECGEKIRAVLMETVGPDGNWSAREKHWINKLRKRFANTLNVTSGGQGAPGNIHSPKTCALISSKLRGKTRAPLSPDHKEKLRITSTGRVQNADSRLKIGAAHKNKIVASATREKLRIANLGKTASDATRRKQSEKASGKKLSPAALAKLIGREVSEDTRVKISQSLQGRQHSQERCARISAAIKGKKKPKRTPEHCAKISANKRAWHAARRETTHV